MEVCSTRNETIQRHKSDTAVHSMPVDEIDDVWYMVHMYLLSGSNSPYHGVNNNLKIDFLFY